MPARGTFVDYCLPNGEYRPALVVREWTPDCAQLQVFPDRVNDGADPQAADWFRSSASRGVGPGTWRDLPIPFSFTVRAPVVPAVPFAVPRCTGADTWGGGTFKPPCPVHGWPNGGNFTLKPSNAAAAAVPGTYETPTEGYPR